MDARKLTLLVLLAVPATAARDVTIYRDTYGVPHVFCKTDPDCTFGYVYAQAEDFFWQVEDNFLRGVGRAAEAYGESELKEDTLNRLLEIPRRAKEQLAHATPRAQALAQAVADALNFYLQKHPEVKPRVITRFEPWHLYAFQLYSTYQSFLFRQSTIRAEEIIGSNTWAIAPMKTLSGKALLFINPHQPFFGPGQWYEGHVHSEEGWDMAGASFFGSPFPTLGHNRDLGWSHTVNHADVTDLYEEHFDDPNRPLAYRYGKQWRQAVEWTETIRVKTGSGFTMRTVTLRKTHHGPIVARRKGTPLALRMAKLESETGSLDQRYRMTRARNLEEFRQAMAALEVPLFNTMYADRTGNIFYLYNAAVPRRAARYDWSKPVDGSDPETEWQGYHPQGELPQLLNPKSGYLQNCNSSPFTTTSAGNPQPKDFPGYMVTEGDNGRARVSRRLLEQREKFSLTDLARAAFDTTVLEAGTDIPALVAGAAGEASLAGPVAELKAWDRRADVKSVAMTLYTLWFARKTEGVAGLRAVVADLEKRWGTWRVPWGEINRTERYDPASGQAFSDALPSLPVAGGPGPIGIVFNFYTRPVPGQKRRYGVAGHSFAGVVEFGDRIEAHTILQFGESGDPRSKHYFDQARLYSEQRFKPAWYTLEEISKNLERAPYRPGE